MGALTKALLPILVAIVAIGSYLALQSSPTLIEDARTALECSVCKTKQLTGTVDDCCIDFKTVDTATRDYFLPLLRELQGTTFFKYFKVDLSKQCPFWHEDGQCFEEACAVCECDPKDVPRKWLEEDSSAKHSRLSNLAAGAAGLVRKPDACTSALRQEKACEESASVEKELGVVDHSHSDPAVDMFNPWEEMASPSNVWTEQEEQEDKMEYVNLELNPEKFTGYSGASARKVWSSIYQENCFEGFSGGQSVCREKRVFFRLMSGLQSSITTQIAFDYHFADGSWGPNVPFFTAAVGAHPDRLTNMYFAYLFLLRALAKAAPLLQTYDYSTGNAAADAVTAQLMQGLVRCDTATSSMLSAAKTASVSSSDSSTDSSGSGSSSDSSSSSVQAALAGVSSDVVTDRKQAAQCLSGFDERGMFEVAPDSLPQSNQAYELELRSKLELKDQFIDKFQNISRIMDCVGCEKCKLWGKLETLGIGTAIKIILASESDEEVRALSRNEVIALVNTAAQLAKSVGSVPHWKALELRLAAVKAAKYTGASLAAAILLVLLAKTAISARRKRQLRQPAAAHASTTATAGSAAGTAAVADKANGAPAAAANGSATQRKKAQ